jgi:hypothetical protein
LIPHDSQFRDRGPWAPGCSDRRSSAEHDPAVVKPHSSEGCDKRPTYAESDCPVQNVGPLGPYMPIYVPIPA